MRHGSRAAKRGHFLRARKASFTSQPIMDRRRSATRGVSGDDAYSSNCNVKLTAKHRLKPSSSARSHLGRITSVASLQPMGFGKRLPTARQPPLIARMNKVPRSLFAFGGKADISRTFQNVRL